MWRLVSLFGCLGLLSACGPSVMTNRMLLAPARATNCSLQFINEPMTSLANSKTWTIIGSVMVADHGEADPMDEEYRALVRKEACKLGGTAVSLGSASLSKQRFETASSAMTYMVLAPAGSATRQPASF